jgi:RimJ/RimL family protein N-acetyltransferase
MIALPAGPLTDMVGKYIMEKTGMELTSGMYQAFMVVNDQQDFVAGVVITNFRKTDCEISCASETPAAWRPTVCKAIFTYIFEQLDCVRCTSITVKGNKKARSFLEGLGFQLEGNVRLGYDGRRDALIYGLLRSECRFLNDIEELAPEVTVDEEVPVKSLVGVE